MAWVYAIIAAFFVGVTFIMGMTGTMLIAFIGTEPASIFWLTFGFYFAVLFFITLSGIRGNPVALLGIPAMIGAVLPLVFGWVSR